MRFADTRMLASGASGCVTVEFGGCGLQAPVGPSTRHSAAGIGVVRLQRLGGWHLIEAPRHSHPLIRFFGSCGQPFPGCKRWRMPCERHLVGVENGLDVPLEERF